MGVLAMMTVPAMHAVQSLLAVQARLAETWRGHGLVLALEQDAAVGEKFTLGGAAVFRWDEHVTWDAERYGTEYVEAWLPESNCIEFDLGKIKGLLWYEPRHDDRSVVETAEAMRRREETGVARTAARYGDRLVS